MEISPEEFVNDGPLVTYNDDGEEDQQDSHVVPATFGRSASDGSELGTGWFAASMLIVNAALGAGLLNFPSAYHQAGGVLTANLVQLVSYHFCCKLNYVSEQNISKRIHRLM